MCQDDAVIAITREQQLPNDKDEEDIRYQSEYSSAASLLRNNT
jgi:hypothetical protein